MSDRTGGAIAPRKPELHQSQITELAMCGIRYEKRYVQGIKRPPGTAAHTGTGTHKGVEQILGHKLRFGTLPDVAEAEQATAEGFDKAWDEQGVILDADEFADGEAVTRGRTKDTAVGLIRLYHAQVAPFVQPVALEKTFTLELADYPCNLAGTIDVVVPNGVRDTKTFKKSPTQDTVDRNVQLTLYGLAFKAEYGRDPETLALDILLKQKEPKVKVMQAAPKTDHDYHVLLSRVDRAYRSIESGIFLPANPTDWWCSRAWCPYFDQCEFGGMQRTSALVTPTVAGREIEF